MSASWPAGYQPVDLAHKVVGVGSVGLRAWIVLLLGRDDADPRFLQVKEAQPSVLEPFARRSSVRNEGQRAVRGQRLMQAAVRHPPAIGAYLGASDRFDRAVAAFAGIYADQNERESRGAGGRDPCRAHRGGPRSLTRSGGGAT